MAAAVSERPAPPSSKVKRPVPPALQTAANGANLTSSPSPSLSSKRLPSGFVHPGSAGLPNGANTPNGATPRLNNRRKDSQKGTDAAKGKAKVGAGESNQADRRNVKKVVEPYVKSPSHILKKFRNRPPSFTIHLHPTHFRFDEQDGSFSYDSPMRDVIQAIRDQEIRPELVEGFHAAGIKFYDNCLIVQVHDHRKASNSSKSAPNKSDKDRQQLFSIHNDNDHITPSPFAPYQKKPSPAAQSQDESKASSEGSEPPQKESGQEPKGPNIFTTVLFSTAASLQEEMMKYATQVDLRSNIRKQSTVNVRTPGSAYPQTPASATPSRPPAKKQKMFYSEQALQEIESKIIASCAPALFLDPAKDFEESQYLIEKLADPLHQREPPAPKSRKRTVAELAADEALAAENERFMLIMDERNGSSANKAAAGMNTGEDAEDGGATFVTGFESFKLLENIKENIQVRKQEAERAKIQREAQQQELKSQQEHEQRQAAEQLARQQYAQKAREAAQLRKQQQQNEQQMRMAQQAANHNPQVSQPQQVQHHLPAPQHGHPPVSAVVTNGHPVSMAQTQHASPAMAKATALNASSPMVNHAMMSNPGASSVAMAHSNSNQGAGSPPRPGSAAHGHPQPGMVHPRQQPPSRHGTPAMPNGTPQMQQATPDMRNVTPRINQNSPAASVAPTPVMRPAMPQNGMNGQQLTPQQHAMLRQQYLTQRMQAAGQGSPPNHMAHPNLQQMAAQNVVQQMQHRPNDAYHQAMQQTIAQQMPMPNGAGHGMPNGMPNGMPMAGNQMAAMQAAAARQGDPTQVQANFQKMWNMLMSNHLAQVRERAMAVHGPNLPAPVVQQCKEAALRMSHAKMNQMKAYTQQQHQQRQQQQMMAQQQQHQQQQQQQQQEMAMMNQMHMMGGMNGMNGMNGMGGMQ